jgi:multiple sugar transport system substrate-binding protein
MTNRDTLSRRQFLHASAATAAVALLAACAPAAAPAGGTGAGTGTGTGAGAASSAAGELIELTLLTPDRELSNRAHARDVTAFNAAMEAAGKPFRVVNIKGPATDGDLQTKLTLDAAAGSLPDLMGANNAWVADFAAAGYLADLGPEFTKWDGWNQYYDVLKIFAEQSGKIIGVPEGSTFNFFYRRDVLEEAGVTTEQPKTWDDFYARCDDIKTKAGIVPCGMPAATPWGGGTWGESFIMVWLSFDGPIFDEADNKWVVSSPNLLKAFQVYETLAQNGWLTVDELLASNPWEPIKYQMFPEGKVGIVTGGDWQWTFDWGPEGATPIEGLFERVDRWQFPSEAAQPFTFIDGGVGMVAASTTKSVEGCAEYIKFINAPEQTCESMEIYIGGPNGRRDFPELCPAYKEIVNGKMYAASQLFDSGRTYKFQRVGTDKMADGVARATEDIITGQATAEQAMETFANDMIESLGPDLAKKA